jgi:hypothetical protein
MNLQTAAGDEVVILLGSPRSGTTWIAKILDSHPDVLYRHEPDTIRREPGVPTIVARNDIPGLLPAARKYLDRLISARNLKSTGPLPVFSKSYRTVVRSYARHLLFYAYTVLETMSGFSPWFRDRQIPDMITRSPRSPIRLVMKLIASNCRARLFAEALPGCKIVYIVREPLGQVASMRRGLRLGKFEKAAPLDECLATDEARDCGLTAERFARLSQIERLAWHWAILNKKAIADLAGSSQAMIVSYDDLCVDPVGQAKAIFAFVGLSWSLGTERFIRASTTSWAPERYYQVYKNTRQIFQKWRSELTVDERKKIMDTVEATAMASYCGQIVAAQSAAKSGPVRTGLAAVRDR